MQILKDFNAIFGKRASLRAHLILVLAALLCASLVLFIHLNKVEIRKDFRRNRKAASASVAEQLDASLRDNYDDLSKLKGHRIKRLPKAIIIGSRKSGTRALLKFLEVNPIIKAASKEVHFFDKAPNYSKGLDWYRSNMPETLENEITIEKSPSYFVTKSVPERIKSMNSSLRLILILRNPVDRLISDFSQLVANKIRLATRDQLATRNELNTSRDEIFFVSNTSNESLWKQSEKDFEDYVLRPDGGVDEQRRAIKVGMYSIHLEKWMSLFSRDQIHFVNGDRMITEPHVELRKLEMFLGLAPKIQANHFVFNLQKGFYCLSANTSNESASGSSYNEEPKCLSESKGRRHVKVGQDLIEKLRNFYAPYNEYLRSITGINFSR